VNVVVCTCPEYAPKTLGLVFQTLAQCSGSLGLVHVAGLSGKYDRCGEMAFVPEYVDAGLTAPVFAMHDTCLVEDSARFSQYLSAVEQLLNEGYDFVGLRPDISMCHMGGFSASFINKIRTVMVRDFACLSKRDRIAREISGWLPSLAEKYGSVLVQEKWRGKTYVKHLDARLWERVWSCGLVKYTRYKVVDEVPV